jgi:hypothetical protein
MSSVCFVYKTRTHIHMLVTKQFAIKKKNSVDLVRQRTIPIERPPLVGEISANFSG